MWSYILKNVILTCLVYHGMGQNFNQIRQNLNNIRQNVQSANQAIFRPRDDSRVADSIVRVSNLPDIAKGQRQSSSPIFSEAPRNEESTRNAITSLTAAYDNALSQTQVQSSGFPSFMPFNPSTIVNSKAQAISRNGSIFLETSKALNNGMNNNETATNQIIFVQQLLCPFKETIQCDPSSKYRASDGSCNNLENPIWGRSNTPFERFLPPNYDDMFSSFRQKSVTGGRLPLPRVVSSQVHRASSLADLHNDINHITAEFGQFVSHDVNSNAQSTGMDGSPLVCCNADGTVDDSSDKKLLGCLPIEIPPTDPFFGQYNKRCMNFVRAAPTTDLNCTSGYREQLNQVTHFIDGSTVYGSEANAMNELRSMTDGLLKVTPSPNGDLLLQDPTNPGCASSIQHCFKAGEARVNQQPALMTLHTIFLREHNRVARQLKTVNPSWNDERLFQEARKIVGAEIQHITYKYYLPAIMGEAISSRFGFVPQAAGSYFTGYDPTFKPAIRNGFAAAAYRFAHSTVRDRLAPNHILKDHFLNPAILYEPSKGPSFVTRNLIQDRQQKTDNLLSDQLTNHLFEKAPGTGLDLASINIKRGRDHGLLGYNFWRVWCGLPRANRFTAEQGGLVDHVPEVAMLLDSVYSHVDDIDLWTGIVTEMPLRGRAVGPTGACMIGRQFWTMKHADRFYYETNDNAAKFKIERLDEIRKTSLGRIICDNTDMTTIPTDVFHEVSSQINPSMSCSDVPGIDFSKWSECQDNGWSNWSPFSRCGGGFRFRTRMCNSRCAPCEGDSFQIEPCSQDIRFPRP